MENNVKNNFFFACVPNQKYPKKKWSIWSKSIIYTILTIIVIVAFVVVGFEIAPRGWSAFAERISKIFTFSNTLKDYPNDSLINLSLEYLWFSIQGTIIGTTLGFMTAFVSATFSNKHLIRNDSLSFFLKIIMAVLRALPSIVLIYFFSNSFSSNLTLVLVLWWFSWIWVHKYMTEIYANLNYYSYYQSIIQGNSKINSYLKTIIPQLNNKFISLFLYSFDSNIRWSSILGTLGLAGIGQLIQKASDGQYESMGIPVLTIMVFLIILEIFIFLFNRYLLNHKSLDFKKSAKEFVFYVNYKTYIKFFLFLAFMGILLYSLITLDWSQSTYSDSNFLGLLFNPNWSVLNQKSQDLNLGLDILTLIMETIVIMFIALILALFLIFISCYKLFKFYALLGIFISTIIRSIPIIALYFVINPLFNSVTASTAAICLIFAISTATIINKNITESINKLSSQTINHYLIQGYSKFTIFCKYVLPAVKNDFIAIFLFQWECQYRDLITYGQYGSSAIGSYMYTYFGKYKQVANMAAFMWIAFFITLLIIFINYVIKFFLVEKKNLFKSLANVKQFISFTFLKCCQFTKNFKKNCISFYGKIKNK